MHRNLKKLLAGLLSVMMVITSAPISAGAAETVGVTDETLEEVPDENQTEVVEFSEENSGEERSSISDNVQTGEEKESSSSFITEEQASESEESSIFETEQTESQTVTESLTEDSEKITQTETTVESTIIEESTEEVTQDYETEAETEEQTAEDEIALNASGSGVAEKLNSVLANYPAGKYWNIINGHAGVNDTACPTHKDAYGNYIVSPTCIRFSDRYYGDSSVGQCWGLCTVW